MRYYPLAFGAFVAFSVVATVFDIRERGRVDRLQAEVDQLRTQRDSLLVVNVDLQKRVDVQLELNRREEERLKHADEISDRAFHAAEFGPDIETAMRNWYDAGSPRVSSWGEFYRLRDERRRDGGN